MIDVLYIQSIFYAKGLFEIIFYHKHLDNSKDIVFDKRGWELPDFQDSTMLIQRIANKLSHLIEPKFSTVKKV